MIPVLMIFENHENMSKNPKSWTKLELEPVKINFQLFEFNLIELNRK